MSAVQRSWAQLNDPIESYRPYRTCILLPDLRPTLKDTSPFAHGSPRAFGLRLETGCPHGVASQDEVDVKQATIWRNFRLFVGSRFRSEEERRESAFAAAACRGGRGERGADESVRLEAWWPLCRIHPARAVARGKKTGPNTQADKVDS